jgi:signal peptidase I
LVPTGAGSGTEELEASRARLLDCEAAAGGLALDLEPSFPVPGAIEPELAIEPAVEGQRRPLSTWLHLAVAAVVLYAALFHLSVVRGSSMFPSIRDGDRILIDPLTFLLQGIQRGDIVVLQYPLDPSIDYVKRVVGLPGDEIVIEEGEVWVNGELLSEPYVESPDPFCSLRTRVKPAHYFVLGDNRRRSCDSREFGQVPQGYVRGKVELCLWPPARAGLIGT